MLSSPVIRRNDECQCIGLSMCLFMYLSISSVGAVFSASCDGAVVFLSKSTSDSRLDYVAVWYFGTVSLCSERSAPWNLFQSKSESFSDRLCVKGSDSALQVMSTVVSSWPAKYSTKAPCILYTVFSVQFVATVLTDPSCQCVGESFVCRRHRRRC